MSWFGSDTVEAVGNTTSKITGGIRHLFTGDIPPEILQEMNRIDEEFLTKRWEADNKIPWYLSSRAIVMLWLNFHSVAMVYLVIFTEITMADPAVIAIISMTGVVNTAFFGSKGIEYIKAGKSP